MIYGLNFNGKEIPPGIKRKFAARMRHHIGGKKVVWFYLQGVGQSMEERDWMLNAADNGHRQFHVEERNTAGGTWYGIYVY